MNAILTALSNEQEWDSGESTPSPSQQCGLGSNPGIDSIRGYTWVELIVGSQSLAPRNFFSVYSGFPCTSKPTLSNSNLI